jgi:pimeloyl-ACP methyl ester carboxylesterase
MKPMRSRGLQGVFGGEGPAPSAVVVLLHGGPEESLHKPWPWDTGRARLGAFAPALQAAGGRFNLAVLRVRYEVRGWNGAACSPVSGVETTLDSIQAEAGPIPVALVGHSMGGRIAALLAPRPEVAVVVGLAPWWPQGEGRFLRRGQSVLVLQGRKDHVVDPASTRRQIEEARGRGVAAEWVEMAGGHAMVRDWRSWHSLTADFVVSRLLAG